jgi:putative Holliday junction resolvase
MSRILAIDYGKKRVGLALSDPTRTLARGLPTLERRPGKPLAETIEQLVERHAVAEVLVGLPLNIDGTSGERAREVERFAGTLRARLSIPVTLRDERLSTVRAYGVLRERGTKARAGKAHVDRVSAALFLQDYLDAQAPRQRADEDGSRDPEPAADPVAGAGGGTGSDLSRRDGAT